MKTTIKLFIVFALALAAFSQHSSVNAGGGQAFNFKGPSVLASFYSASGCIVTEVFVIATESRVQGQPGPADTLSYASTTVWQYDSCTDTPLLYAYGSTSPLSGSELQISKQLNSATLNTTVNLFDEVSGNTFDVVLNLSWNGVGPLSREHSTTHFRAPGCITNSRFQSKSRPAEVAGSVSDGLVSFTSGADASASLHMVKNGTVVIGCTQP